MHTFTFFNAYCWKSYILSDSQTCIENSSTIFLTLLLGIQPLKMWKWSLTKMSGEESALGINLKFRNNTYYWLLQQFLQRVILMPSSLLSFGSSPAFAYVPMIFRKDFTVSSGSLVFCCYNLILELFCFVFSLMFSTIFLVLSLL